MPSESTSHALYSCSIIYVFTKRQPIFIIRGYSFSSQKFFKNPELQDTFLDTVRSSTVSHMLFNFYGGCRYELCFSLSFVLYFTMLSVYSSLTRQEYKRKELPLRQYARYFAFDEHDICPDFLFIQR
jgi:hypothetical protein